jgi:hypothetical protein
MFKNVSQSHHNMCLCGVYSQLQALPYTTQM